MASKLSKLTNLVVKASVLAKPHLETFWYYGKVELAPPKISDIPAVMKGISNLMASAKSGAWKNLTVKQSLLNLLVGIEVGGWFFIGECIGKRHLVGYKLN